MEAAVSCFYSQVGYVAKKPPARARNPLRRAATTAAVRRPSGVFGLQKTTVYEGKSPKTLPAPVPETS